MWVIDVLGRRISKKMHSMSYRRVTAESCAVVLSVLVTIVEIGIASFHNNGLGTTDERMIQHGTKRTAPVPCRPTRLELDTLTEAVEQSLLSTITTEIKSVCGY